MAAVGPTGVTGTAKSSFGPSRCGDAIIFRRLSFIRCRWASSTRCSPPSHASSDRTLLAPPPDIVSFAAVTSSSTAAPAAVPALPFCWKVTLLLAGGRLYGNLLRCCGLTPLSNVAEVGRVGGGAVAGRLRCSAAAAAAAGPAEAGRRWFAGGTAPGEPRRTGSGDFSRNTTFGPPPCPAWCPPGAEAGRRLPCVGRPFASRVGLARPPPPPLTGRLPPCPGWGGGTSSIDRWMRASRVA